VTVATARPAIAFRSVLARERGLDPLGLAFPDDRFRSTASPALCGSVECISGLSFVRDKEDVWGPGC
jgi:hypothetical protein